MPRFFAWGAALAAVLASVAADQCERGAINEKGNWFCQQVKKVKYTDVGGEGVYEKVTGMSPDGKCSFEPVTYSAPCGPFCEELSVHFRGPIHLKKLAVFIPQKPEEVVHQNHRRHIHLDKHKHRARSLVGDPLEKRAVGEEVCATINGEHVCWTNEYDGTPDGAASAASSVPAGDVNPRPIQPKYVPPPAAVGDWVRAAYYDAEQQIADGLVILNNKGDEKTSGVFDFTFGNSLSYSTPDGRSSSSHPEVLADALIPSNEEISVFSNKRCENNSCGFVRDGTVAYHGFEGCEKAFIMKFSMPDDACTTPPNANKPAAWFLNAQIPRTAQYDACSCWDSGCGEVDAFEALDEGGFRLKSTIHAKPYSAGSSDWFPRPFDEDIVGAVIFRDGNIVVEILDGFDFPESLTSSDIDHMIDDDEIDPMLLSLFQLRS